MRDGTDVQTNERCTVTTGNWTSPYDGVTFDTGRDLDIDHFIPLKNAWTVSTNVPFAFYSTRFEVETNRNMTNSSFF